ncbi:MAG: hypothetical protein OXH51_10860 [Gemmatimonadetes bacterium]|nr:hypothetical protein [Gemmatimonadota bacterium]MCY3677411.1 hypothetical protein [Gemmatimonadota bacterium]
MSEHLRNIGGAVLGWVVMFGCVVILMAGFWMMLGADGAFQAGSWEVSGAWNFGTIVINLIAAIVGGLVCARVSADKRGVWMLVALVVVLGVASALPDAPMGDAVAVVRPPDVSMTEAMMTAQEPEWMAWLYPVLGAVGALLGARLVKSG